MFYWEVSKKFRSNYFFENGQVFSENVNSLFSRTLYGGLWADEWETAEKRLTSGAYIVK